MKLLLSLLNTRIGLVGILFMTQNEFAPHAFAVFQNVPAAQNVKESEALFPQREKAVLEYFAGLELGEFKRENGTMFPVKAIARLKLGKDVALVNERLLDPKAVAYAKVGTDFQHLGNLCKREGDYDFALRGLVQLTYEFWDKPELLYPETKEKLLKVLLTETGNEVSFYRTYCKVIKVYETENHILLTEGSRLLINQLWMRHHREQGTLTPELEKIYNNDLNGMNEFMSKHLTIFLKHDFEEFNSRPYMKFTWGGLQNIFEYAEDSKVKLVAQMVMDYVGARFAISSKDLRRFTPFCRQPQHRKDDDFLGTDAMGVIYSVLAGNFQFAGQMKDPWSFDHWTMLAAAIGKYRAPTLVLDLIFNHAQSGRAFLQRHDHLAKEIYAGSPSFLISAGGKFKNQFDMASGKIDAWGLATTLIPAHSGLYLNDVFHFKGSSMKGRVNNTCVTHNFACGLNPYIPKVPQTCMSTVKAKHGTWTFVDYTKPECFGAQGFYVAQYQNENGSLGFLEASEPSLSFQEFTDRILENNSVSEGKKYDRRGWNVYVTSTGHPVRFKFAPMRLNEDAIESNVPSMLADGDLMVADGKGYVEVKNPFTGKKLILDASKAGDPVRKE